MYKSL